MRVVSRSADIKNLLFLGVDTEGVLSSRIALPSFDGVYTNLPSRLHLWELSHFRQDAMRICFRLMFCRFFGKLLLTTSTFTR
jgi:hypothetical protein